MPLETQMMSVSAPLPGATKKKKTIAVRLNVEQPPPKRQFLVARRPKKGEDIHHDTISNVGSPAKLRVVRRGVDGGIVDRSIVGSTDVFEEINAQFNDAQHVFGRRAGGCVEHCDGG